MQHRRKSIRGDGHVTDIIARASLSVGSASAMMMISAVIMQITTVSMKGSNRALNPSETGRRVLTAE